MDLIPDFLNFFAHVFFSDEDTFAQVIDPVLMQTTPQLLCPGVRAVFTCITSDNILNNMYQRWTYNDQLVSVALRAAPPNVESSRDIDVDFSLSVLLADSLRLIAQLSFTVGEEMSGDTLSCTALNVSTGISIGPPLYFTTAELSLEVGNDTQCEDGN